MTYWVDVIGFVLASDLLATGFVPRGLLFGERWRLASQKRIGQIEIETYGVIVWAVFIWVQTDRFRRQSNNSRPAWRMMSR